MSLRDMKIKPLGVGPDQERFLIRWWREAPGPDHTRLYLGAKAYRARMTRIHTAYRAKRRHW